MSVGRRDSGLAHRLHPKSKRPARSGPLLVAMSDVYCGRGTSGAACGVVGLGVGGGGAARAGGAGARCVRPVVSGAGVVAVRVGVPVKTRSPASSRATTMAGRIQAGRSLTT